MSRFTLSLALYVPALILLLVGWASNDMGQQIWSGMFNLLSLMMLHWPERKTK